MGSKIIVPVILCGGSGTRLWPLSTPHRPKQFQELLSGKSMLALTLERVAGKAGSLDFSAPIIIGSSQHRESLRESVPHAKIVLEPFGRNSAPAVAAACLRAEPGDILIVLPADQNIIDVSAFHKAVQKSVSLAQAGQIVTFGIRPKYPATGYGYIRAGVRKGAALRVESFVEKPDAKTAQSYLDQGNYFWNAGIFVFQVSTMLEALETFEPGMLKTIARALEPQTKQILQLDGEVFSGVKNISIDHSVMERARNVVTVPVSMGWSDVGSFEALHELLAEDDVANVAHGPVSIESSSGCYVRSDGVPLFVSGLSGLAVVTSQEAVMVAPKGDMSAVKSMAAHFNNHRDRMNVSETVCAQADRFMRQVFSAWQEVAWDTRAGSFVEQLNLDGSADLQAERRIRVQARQIYSFSKGAERDWVSTQAARQIVEKGVEFLMRPHLRLGGGWGHSVSARGELVNKTRDFYDHTFLILAGAAAWKAFRIPLARNLAFEAFEFVNKQLADEKRGGWFESVPAPAYRRSNPHMHMLEAMLELYHVTGDKRALKVADEVVGLFESYFFRPGYDELIERFAADWTPDAAPGESHIEPGHHFEWASLLTLHHRMTGHDTLSWQRRLIRCADACGLDSDELAFNVVTAAGERVNQRKRLWPQLEMLRAHLMHPTLRPMGGCEELFNKIDARYLSGNQPGMWIDELDEEGRPISNTVPASMLYHFVTCFGVLAPKT